MGTFLFRWPYPADHVYVTGSFDDWGKSERLDKVGDGFEKEVQLSSADKKVTYKFVVDDKWIVDNAAPKEDDGHNNVNNVLLPSDIKPNAPKAPTVSAGGEGAPLLTKEQSEANLARQIPHVTPDPNRPVTRTSPQVDGPTAKDSSVPGAFPETPAHEPEAFTVAPIPAVGHQDIQSSVTTSKEAYESAGGEGTAGSQNIGVSPLPATGHDDIQSSVTTSKEAYEKAGNEGTANNQEISVNPIPATGHEDIQSSVTTSKEAYEKAGALGLAGAAVGGVGAAVASVFSKPKSDDKNIIPESSLPLNPEKIDTVDTGPFISSAGPGTTTADLASKVPFEPKREAQVIEPEAPNASKEASATPFIASSGPGTTTADLASKVPLEPKTEAQVIEPEAPSVSKEASAVPFIASSGPGTTTAALASTVPLEGKREASVIDDVAAAAPPEIAAEKSAVEKELLTKVPESQAAGEPASAAAAQSSYHGLATSVPETVEQSIAKANTSGEAATEASVVAEKSEVERELQSKIPVEEAAGEPAPTLSAVTATTAPDSTTAATTVANVTDGKTANEPIPATDTSTHSHGLLAGEVAGGTAVGAAAVAGAAVLAGKHNDKSVEPPRVDDSVKPSITTEAAPATQLKSETVVPPTTSAVAASHAPGVSPIAGAAIADGTEGPGSTEEPSAPKTKAHAETSEATATEYAPPIAPGTAPGISPTAAAALSDGTEDPTLKDEPAVKMMAQNEKDSAAAATGLTGATAPAPTTTSVSSPTDAKADVKDVVEGQASDVKTTAPETPQKAVAGTAAAAATPGSTSSTPAQSTTDSPVTGDKKKKRRHRLSQIIKKIFD